MQMVLSGMAVPIYAEETAAYQEPESPSVCYNMNIDWKYKRAADGRSFPLKTALEGVAKDGKNFYEKDYDDSDWSLVSVPHPINAEDSFDGVGVDAGEGSLYRGFMFYRKNITIPQTDAGKKFFLEFEAVRQSVYLYVNGEMVGYYEAGIAPIGFDITNYVKAGEENLIAVATENRSDRGLGDKDANGIVQPSTRETIPGHEAGDLSGIGYQWNTKDFNEVQGGITGNVNLYAKGKIYQTLPLYNNLKTTGNYIYGSNFDLRAKSADITVEAEVRNESGAAKDITLEVNVVDGDGNLVSTFSETANVAAASDAGAVFKTTVPETAYNGTEGVENNNVDISTVNVTKITASKNISDLNFWSDTSPYLYTVYTILKDGDTIIDLDKTTTGFRDVQYDKDKGLQINGISTYLKGYAQRATNEWAAIGVANDWLTDVDMQLVKESNANFIRWMHVAPKPNAIRSGDKYGIVSVAPAGDKEGDITGRGWDQRVEAMRDTIIYFRNSPSVIFYEAGNNAITAAHMQEMTDLRKALDPNGGRYMGCRTISSEDQIKAAEWAGTMLYRHDADAYASMQKTDHYIPMLETEYHRNEAPRRVWDDYSPPDYDYVNKWLGSGGTKTDGFDIWDQTQEDFSRTMFNSGDGYSYYYNNRVGGSGKNEYTGAAMMVWSDSNMHVRNCGVENCRTSGRVDPIRVKKESFYAIQAAQSDTPAVHILGHWNYPEYIKDDKEKGNYWYEDKTFVGNYWKPNGTLLQRDPTKKTVYVIGSGGLSKVELYVNDKLVGTDTTPTDNYIYEFPNIDVTQSGKAVAKAYNERGEVAAEHELVTAGKPVAVRLTPVTGPDGLIADGSDLVYVDVEIIDEAGNICPLDERKINFTISDNTKAAFLGGYNSGIEDRIVNHKDYVFAECGINRVFVRSTRTAGEFTLTATAEGMQPASVTLTSNALELTNGLTETAQRSFKQGEVPAPPAPQTAPALKSLAEIFTADWSEGGNVVKVSEDEKDYYTVKVNGTEVQFTDKAYKPDSSTGVVGELHPILDAIKAAGAVLTYTYTTDGSVPDYASVKGGVLPYITITSGDRTTEVYNNATDVFDGNHEPNLTNFGVTPNSAKTTLTAELSAVLGRINGVTLITDEENKTLNITVEKPPAAAELSDVMDAVETFDEQASEESYDSDISYIDGVVTITTTKAITNGNVITAYYKGNTLDDIKIEKVTLAALDQCSVSIDGDAVEAADMTKIMLWDSDMSKIKPLSKALIITKGTPPEPAEPTAEPTPKPKPDEVYEYDTVMSLQDGSAEVSGLTTETADGIDGAYYKNTSGDELKFPGLDGDSKADILWEADVRFDEDGGGIVPRNKANNYGTCIRRNENKLAIQTGGSSYTKYVDIDPEKWYHIALIGRYSAPDARTDMIVYEYNGSEKTLLGTYENVNQRNLSANNKNGAQYWGIWPGTSADNVKITMLGADTLNVTSNADTIKAGNTMPFDYSASRAGAYITKPAVEWAIYDENNENLLNDENITIGDDGILNVGLNAESKAINVSAAATIKEGKTISASKKINVTAVDISDVKFDKLELTAEKDYVSADKPLQITASASKGGESVNLTADDLIWYACDKNDLSKLGDDLKWIKIENGKVTVDPKAISQDITIRAADPTDAVRGSIAVHIKSSDALENGEDGAKDVLLTADSCETPLTNAKLTEGAPDGTHAYTAEAGYQTAHITETAGDIVVEMDIKFNKEGAGFQPAKSGKINTCVIYHNGQFCIETSGGKFTQYGEISSDKWYHITLIRKKGAYAHIVLEEYDENGERTNKQIFKDVSQRNNENTAFVNINAGTSYDNIRILQPVPTDITISTDVETVFAGGTVQAASQLLWNGLEMKAPDASMFEYKLYDAEDRYPLESDAITVNADGLITVSAIADAQDVHIRAVAKQSGKYASAKFSVTSSDILKINQIGVTEDESKIAKIFLEKAFFYNDEITFVTEIIDENGAIKSINVKEIYGDSLRIGENNVSVDVDLTDFDKTKDTIKVYAVTKLSTDEITEPDGSMTVSKTANNVSVTKAPAFDTESSVLVLAIKADADETRIKAEDVVYLTSVKAEDLSSISIPANGEVIVKTAGKINGVLTVKAAEKV